MKRTDFCKVTGVNLERLKGLGRRGILPWVTQGTDEKWSRVEYTALRAFALVAFDRLFEQGVSMEMASKALLGIPDLVDITRSGPVVASPVGFFERTTLILAGLSDAKPTKDRRNDVWIGFALAAHGEEPRLLFGTMVEVAEDVAAMGVGAGRVFLSNFTDAIRTVQRNAEELGNPDVIAEVTSLDQIERG